MQPANLITVMLAALSLGLVLGGTQVLAEGSRQLYPDSYPGAGSRADLDVQNNGRYMNRVLRRGFIYVYAEAGEYITLGSSNIGSGGDVSVFLPQDFGIPGDETMPSSVDFLCSDNSPSLAGTHFSGAGLGQIQTRSEELAGPNSPDDTVSISNGFTPCAMQAPSTGIYGVLFSGAGNGDNPNGDINDLSARDDTIAGWDVTVRESRDSVADLNGRVFTYAFIGFTGRNDRPVFSTLYYVTGDGYRYQQELRGLDPNGYALYANTFGFLDDNEPLYKSLRSDGWSVSNLPLGVSAQAAEYPIFFSDIGPGRSAEPGLEKVLAALGIPLTPPSPQISNVSFDGALGGSVTSTGTGGVFSFNTSDTVSYQVVISRNGSNFDPAEPGNRVLTGIAYSGTHQVSWNGLDNSHLPFPASADPYAFRASGRNGEVHFPIIDAENNGNPSNPAVPGGGPTITRLNGTAPNDTTVFFDDRGYLTRSGEKIGTLNGTLCPNPIPAASTELVSLSGIDSSDPDYRLWQYGNNRNDDCAADAGWGDAKGVNLWTYFLTPPADSSLEIRDFPVDVATAVTVVDTAEQGDTVQGSFSFGNNGTDTATEVTYSMTITPGLGTVAFDNLPSSTADAVYNSDDGTVTFTNFPTSLSPGETFANMTFSYTAPASGPVVVTTGIDTTDDDQLPANNTASATTAIGSVDVATEITGVPDQADPGSTVTGSILFSNVGTDDAAGMTYQVNIGSSGNIPSDVLFTSLPSGITASYDTDTGEVTLTGMPATLTAGQVLSISFSYTAPLVEGGAINIDSTISTSSTDANPANNADTASTTVDFPVGASIEIAAAGICAQDAPWVTFDITPVNFSPTNLATVEFIDSDGTVAATHTDQPLSGGRLLWPGATVGGDGVGETWPGWERVDDEWQSVDSLVRPDLRVRISVNPTAETTVSYPSVSSACVAGPRSELLPRSNTQAVPMLPAPLLVLMVGLLGLVGARGMGRGRS